ncbi:hypothetical protein FACUT_13804 [Fusarium acutatum]|uniref:Uncharacterized protein n=1 Tax=Fusarium acutatum TaxID=78861 RepID=A0A8H4J8G3_9HYPO|nr:hypothetical protein FACUT_13804 [Fusarium acutatum]
MVPSKRLAPIASNYPRAKVSRRPANNDVQQTATSREAAERLSENTRPYQHGNAGQFVGQLVRVRGEAWSQAHEDALDRMWRESEHSQALVKMVEAATKNKGRTTQPQLLTLFKVCLRVFKMSPIRFLSFSHGLEYLGGSSSSATFSKSFSDTLTYLIVHPAFNGKKETLATVIQYAVICRIDDRRPWPNSASTPNCPALAKMSEVIKASETGQYEDSIHKTHTYARRECVREGDNPSTLSDLLHAVGEAVKESGGKGFVVTDDMLEYRGEVVWPVCIYDLRNIVKTLNDTIWDNDSWNCTVAEAFRSYPIHKQKLRDWMVKSGFDPHQQARDEPGEGLKLEVMDRDVAQDQARPCDVDVTRGGGTLGHDPPTVRLLSHATSNPYASLESQQTSPAEGASLDRIRDLEKEVASLRQEVASFKDMGREIANLKAEVASLKAADPQNETRPAFLQLFSNRTIGPDPESHLDWDVTGMRLS